MRRSLRSSRCRPRPYRRRLRKVRASEQFADIPFLMVTAEAQQDNIIEAVQAKVSNYIVKPFTADTMKQKIDKIFA